jgi:hypothetical protein
VADLESVPLRFGQLVEPLILLEHPNVLAELLLPRRRLRLPPSGLLVLLALLGFTLDGLAQLGAAATATATHGELSRQATASAGPECAPCRRRAKGRAGDDAKSKLQQCDSGSSRDDEQSVRDSKGTVVHARNGR